MLDIRLEVLGKRKSWEEEVDRFVGGFEVRSLRHKFCKTVMRVKEV